MIILDQRKIFFEQFFRQTENAVCDEKCGKDIDRIVQMPQQNAGAEQYGNGDQNIANDLVLPKD